MHQGVKLVSSRQPSQIVRAAATCTPSASAAGALETPRSHLRRLRRAVEKIRPAAGRRRRDYAPDAVEQTGT